MFYYTYDSWDYQVGTGYGSRKTMKATQVSSLLDWVPNLAAVTGLRISTQDKCNPNTCKQIVKKLAAAVPDSGSSKKSKKNSGKKKNLAKLVLHGPKIYGSLMAGKFSFVLFCRVNACVQYKVSTS